MHAYCAVGVKLGLNQNIWITRGLEQLGACLDSVRVTEPFPNVMNMCTENPFDRHLIVPGPQKVRMKADP